MRLGLPAPARYRQDDQAFRQFFGWKVSLLEGGQHGQKPPGYSM